MYPNISHMYPNKSHKKIKHSNINIMFKLFQYLSFANECQLCPLRLDRSAVILHTASTAISVVRIPFPLFWHVLSSEIISNKESCRDCFLQHDTSQPQRSNSPDGKSGFIYPNNWILFLCNCSLMCEPIRTFECLCRNFVYII